MQNLSRPRDAWHPAPAAAVAARMNAAASAAMLSRIVTADVTISPFADIMRCAPDMRNPRSVAMLQYVFGPLT